MIEHRAYFTADLAQLDAVLVWLRCNVGEHRDSDQWLHRGMGWSLRRHFRAGDDTATGVACYAVAVDDLNLRDLFRLTWI